MAHLFSDDMAVIYSKTLAGQTALHSRAVKLTPRQRSAFIMFDGKRSLDEVLRLTSGIGVTPADVDELVALDLLEATQSNMATEVGAQGQTAPVTSADLRQLVTPSSASSTFTAPVIPDSAPGIEAQATYLRAYPIATRLTAELGFRGIRLNLAVEGVGNLQQLRELAPKIRDAVGVSKFKALEDALR